MRLNFLGVSAMAKVNGPLMSMDATGSFAGTLVFQHWKGRNTVRQLVKPSNPKTSGQLVARNAMIAAAAICSVINQTTDKHSALAVRDETALRNAAPSGQSWNGFFTKELIGPGQAKFDAATTAWAGVSQAGWETAAAALDVPYTDKSKQVAPLASPDEFSHGELFFRHVYGLYTAGILATAPTTAPTYA